MANTRAILDGYRVLDLSSVVMGPYGTQQLADLGADVIWIEPHGGQAVRGMGPGTHHDFSGIALNLLRNKRSVAVDMKTNAGREVVLKLAATCDAVLTNLRPAALKRLRLGYEDIAAVKPQIVYCQAQGFRTDGPRANEAAYDDIIQAESGIADAARRTGHGPMLAPSIIADKVCGMAIAQAMIAGLLHRERTGEGQRIEVPMLDVMRAFMLVEHGAGAVASPEDGVAGYARILSPERGPQQTSDGWINILPYSRKAYEAIFRAGGRNDMIGDPRLEGRSLSMCAEFLYGQIRPIIARKTTAEWLDFCVEHDVPVGRISTLEEVVGELGVMEHPQAGAYRVLPAGAAILYTRTPAQIRSHAPLPGQHSDEIIAELGYSAEEIADLHAAGIVS
ncbi:MAG: CoA transferase [Pseudomonadota bacterium]